MNDFDRPLTEERVDVLSLHIFTGVPEVLRARVCGAGVSVSGRRRVSLLPDTESGDSDSPQAAHRYNLHRHTHAPLTHTHAHPDRHSRKHDSQASHMWKTGTLHIQTLKLCGGGGGLQMCALLPCEEVFLNMF